MIFLTVGTQLPFDRLVSAMDHWAGINSDVEIVAQTKGGSYIAKNFRCEDKIDSVLFRELLSRSEIVVSHAGMGTIISCLELAIPIIIVPRRAALGEHRNDHQLSTAREFGRRKGVWVAEKQDQLCDLLDQRTRLADGMNGNFQASDGLVRKIAEWVSL